MQKREKQRKARQMQSVTMCKNAKKRKTMQGETNAKCDNVLRQGGLTRRGEKRKQTDKLANMSTQHKLQTHFNINYFYFSLLTQTINRLLTKVLIFKYPIMVPGMPESYLVLL